MKNETSKPIEAKNADGDGAVSDAPLIDRPVARKRRKPAAPESPFADSALVSQGVGAVLDTVDTVAVNAVTVAYLNAGLENYEAETKGSRAAMSPQMRQGLTVGISAVVAKYSAAEKMPEFALIVCTLSYAAGLFLLLGDAAKLRKKMLAEKKQADNIGE